MFCFILRRRTLFFSSKVFYKVSSDAGECRISAYERRLVIFGRLWLLKRVND